MKKGKINSLQICSMIKKNSFTRNVRNHNDVLFYGIVSICGVVTDIRGWWRL